MQLTLGLVNEVTSSEYRVQILENDSNINIPLSPPLQERLHIRPGQVVAVDKGADTPQIAFRWHYNRVARIEGDRIFVDDHRGGQIEVVRAEGVELNPQVDDHVFVTLGGPAGKSELFDIARDERPLHPENFVKYGFPMVEEFYRRRNSQQS